MVKLRVAARVIPETSFLNSYDAPPAAPCRGEKKFMLVVREPENWYIGTLAIEVQKKYKDIYKLDIGKVKYLKDNDTDCDLDPEDTVADILLDDGKFRQDGLDQNVTIKIIQEEGAPLRAGSVVPDLTPVHYQYVPRLTLPPVPRFADVSSALGKHGLGDTNDEQEETTHKRARNTHEVDESPAPEQIVSSIEQDSQLGSPEFRRASHQLPRLHGHSQEYPLPLMNGRHSLVQTPFMQTLDWHTSSDHATPSRRGQKTTLHHRTSIEETTATNNINGTTHESLQPEGSAEDEHDTTVDQGYAAQRPSISPAPQQSSSLKRRFQPPTRGDVYNLPESDIEDSQMSPRSRNSRLPITNATKLSASSKKQALSNGRKFLRPETLHAPNATILLDNHDITGKHKDPDQPLHHKQHQSNGLELPGTGNASVTKNVDTLHEVEIPSGQYEIQDGPAKHAEAAKNVISAADPLMETQTTTGPNTIATAQVAPSSPSSTQPIHTANGLQSGKLAHNQVLAVPPAEVQKSQQDSMSTNAKLVESSVQSGEDVGQHEPDDPNITPSVPESARIVKTTKSQAKKGAVSKKKAPERDSPGMQLSQTLNEFTQESPSLANKNRPEKLKRRRTPGGKKKQKAQAESAAGELAQDAIEAHRQQLEDDPASTVRTVEEQTRQNHPLEPQTMEITAIESPVRNSEIQERLQSPHSAECLAKTSKDNSGLLSPESNEDNLSSRPSPAKAVDAKAITKTKATVVPQASDISEIPLGLTAEEYEIVKLRQSWTPQQFEADKARKAAERKKMLVPTSQLKGTVKRGRKARPSQVAHRASADTASDHTSVGSRSSPITVRKPPALGQQPSTLSEVSQAATQEEITTTVPAAQSPAMHPATPLPTMNGDSGLAPAKTPLASKQRVKQNKKTPKTVELDQNAASATPMSKNTPKINATARIESLKKVQSKQATAGPDVNGAAGSSIPQAAKAEVRSPPARGFPTINTNLKTLHAQLIRASGKNTSAAKKTAVPIRDIFTVDSSDDAESTESDDDDDETARIPQKADLKMISSDTIKTQPDPTIRDPSVISSDDDSD